MGIRKNGSRSCISVLCVWFCGERHKSVSAASMQQFTSLNQQRYVTAVVMFFFDFDRITLPFCHVVKSKPRKSKKSAIFKHNKWSPSMPCVAGHVTTNPGKRSDAFHSTSENSENLKQ